MNKSQNALARSLTHKFSKKKISTSSLSPGVRYEGSRGFITLGTSDWEIRQIKQDRRKVYGNIRSIINNSITN